MSQNSDWGAWLALKMVRGVGNITALNLTQAFGSPAAVLAARADALQCAGVRPELARAIRRFDGWRTVQEQLARLDAVGGRLVTWADASYPEQLRQIYDAPLFVFVRGELTPDDALAVAIVGARAPSAYGVQMAAIISEGIAQAGLTVVSGLARGIDAAAHAAALSAGGRTIAVLGCGIDVVYPSEHHRLQMQIAKNGAVVSEFALGQQPDAENFPSRNRIISGLSLGTVVVEATEKSGSLITAEYALEQNREVFAVPGPVGARSRGPHRLIKQGATLVEGADDVLNEIAPYRSAVRRQPIAPPVPALDGVQAQVYAALDEAGVHVDGVVVRSGLPAAQVLEVLLGLELVGLVHQLPGQRYARRPAVRRRGTGGR